MDAAPASIVENSGRGTTSESLDVSSWDVMETVPACSYVVVGAQIQRLALRTDSQSGDMSMAMCGLEWAHARDYLSCARFSTVVVTEWSEQRRVSERNSRPSCNTTATGKGDAEKATASTSDRTTLEVLSIPNGFQQCSQRSASPDKLTVHDAAQICEDDIMHMHLGPPTESMQREVVELTTQDVKLLPGDFESRPPDSLLQ